MVKIDREKLAWAAGFFDGEGTICAQNRVYRGKSWRELTIAVSQAGDEAPEILERFKSCVGGIGKVYLTHGSKRKEHYKQGYSWRVTKFEHVQAVVAMLWSWLGTRKRTQCELALRTFSSWPRRNMTSERGKLMARRRWENAPTSIRKDQRLVP